MGTPSFIGDAHAIVESTVVAYVAEAFMECLSVCNDALCPPHVCIGCGGISHVGPLGPYALVGPWDPLGPICPVGPWESVGLLDLVGPFGLIAFGTLRGPL